METHLNITGVLLILLALLHVFFPDYFDWKKEFASLKIINRQMMYVHAFFIAFMVLLMGVLCLVSAAELSTTTLGKRVCLGLGIFWATRLFVQFFVYSPSLWKGKTMETIIHILFSLLWIYFSSVFILAYFE